MVEWRSTKISRTTHPTDSMRPPPRGAVHQNLQIAHQLEVEAERRQLASARTLKATSGNAAKRLKIQETVKLPAQAELLKQR